jgi:DNA invertase Pin-like site-specific DNA recombinase
MAKRARTRRTADRAAYDVQAEWTEADLALLEELKRAEALLPEDAPRALLSVRLSVLTEDTTSPARQELDLRIECKNRGWRVAGVASDLNVSATKVPPWKRKELGHWLNERVPEFDVILFWKLDRFVRKLTDLGAMIRWCDRFQKNLVSKHDDIDLKTTAGQIMVTIIGGIAEIETINTGVRVSSLWAYTKTQSDWLIGKPTFGYVTDEVDSRVVLVIDPEAYKGLHWARKRALRGASTSRVVRTLIRAGILTENTAVSSFLRTLRNPALMGYRVEEVKEDGKGTGKSRAVLDKDGQPIRVAEGIFTPEEFESLQAALDKRKRAKVIPVPTGLRTKFLRVLICKDCQGTVTVKVTRNKWGTYPYLRCNGCRSGGIGVSNPNDVYDQVTVNVLSVLGDFPVESREYAQGADARKKIRRLEQTIAQYMKDLEPGGKYAAVRFAREQAEQTLQSLLKQLTEIDPETANDRWVNVANGKTFREHWEDGGLEAMSADLYRVGVKVELSRWKDDLNQTQVSLRIRVPKDVRDRLVLREDGFSDNF